jgi:hypothetical protein
MKTVQRLKVATSSHWTCFLLSSNHLEGQFYAFKTHMKMLDCNRSSGLMLDRRKRKRRRKKKKTTTLELHESDKRHYQIVVYCDF